MLAIHALRALKDNFIYALVEGANCVVVDPGAAAPVEEFLKAHGLKLTLILCTHHHHDHIDGVTELKSRHGCAVVCSEYDRPRIPAATEAVREGEFSVLGRPVEVIATPGHTLGQIAYYFVKEGALFVGDTLFSAGCGRLFEGTPEQMFNSLAKFKRLPPTTKIYFGHEYTLRNLDFVLAKEPRPEVSAYRERVVATLARGEDTTPSELSLEMKVNPFMWSPDAATFARWREERNRW